jgi:hypothetical protein
MGFRVFLLSVEARFRRFRVQVIGAAIIGTAIIGGQDAKIFLVGNTLL